MRAFDSSSGFVRLANVENALGEDVGHVRIAVNVEFFGDYMGCGECPSIVANGIRMSIADKFRVSLAKGKDAA